MIDGRVVWVPSIAPSGLAVYRGPLWLDWQGDLIVGSLVNREVRRIDLDRDGKVLGQQRIFPTISARVRDVRVAPDGALWVTTDEKDGRVLRVTPG
jgi:glucose/arabinose dehydrogenase